MTFSNLGLSAELLRAVTDQGYTAPTPIQAQAIPTILESRDLMATAQTGTGKTAAFTLPLLQRLSTSGSAKGRVRALVLVPTRELAAQVADAVRTYGRHLQLRCVQVYGGVNINPQFRELRGPVDILVATPGRLMDHMQRGSVNLSGVETLILDEADRMLDMGFMPAIERIVKQLPKNRQTLLFSATFSDSIRTLAQRFLQNPASIEVARRNAAAESVEQSAYYVDHARKRELLAHLFDTQNWQQALIFCRTKHGADRLATQLAKSGIESTAIHGDKSQNARMRALSDFKRMKVRALVATDVAARGIDIDELPHVVNFDLPMNPEDYVHRIGRTGRAGQKGAAVSLVCMDERSQFSAIKKLVKLDIPITNVAGFEPSQHASASRPNDRPRNGSGQHRSASRAQPQHRRGNSEDRGNRRDDAGGYRGDRNRSASGGQRQDTGARRSSPKRTGERPRRSDRAFIG
ncbi:MAG: DEAD/DEAH box helicase [Gammaproteobacteria bacterium]